jgi:hypothetical protein
VNRGEADCTIDTDKHSLAVLLYYLFMRGHPLEGRREVGTVVFEASAKLRSFGTTPIFVFNPQDTSNRAVSGIHDTVVANWKRLPSFAKNAFVTTFTDALSDPQKRLNDTQWLDVMSRLRDSLFTCRHCKLETFLDIDAVRASAETNCSFCGVAVALPPRIVFAHAEVCISEGCFIYPHHFGRSRDSAEPLAAFARHETKHEIVGLKNLTNSPFLLRDGDGTSKEVPPGKSVSVVEGRQVDFGLGTGTIRWRETAAPGTRA